MFDLNLINEPGLQAEKNNNTISFLKKTDSIKDVGKTSKKVKKQKSRAGLILFLGLLIAVISAIGFLFLLPLINSKNNLEKPVHSYEITKNEVVSGLIDLLLNEELSQNINQIHIEKELILIKFSNLDNEKIKKLKESDFYGINIRTSINKSGEKSYLFKLPWWGISNPNNNGLTEIKEQIGERFVLSNSYDFTSNSFILIINEFKNIVSILLRLHDSNILQNYEIYIEPGPEQFTTISLKHF